MKNRPLTLAAVAGLLLIAAAAFVFLRPSPSPDAAPAETAVAESAAPIQHPVEQPAPPPRTEKAPAVRRTALEPAADTPPGRPVPPQLADRLSELERLGKDSPDFPNAAIDLANAWAQLDPEGALAWASGLPAGVDRGAAQQVLRSWADTDPSQALDYLNSQGNSRLADYSARYLFSRWSAEDPAAAWEAAASIADAGLRGEIETEIITSWSQSEPGIAAEILTQSLASGHDPVPLLGAFQTAGADLARVDPSAATAWIPTLPEGSARAAALNGLITVWSPEDPAAASAWLRDFPPGGARDAGVTALVQIVRRENPSAAIAWANSIGDSRIRERLTGTVALAWLSSDPTSARTAIQGDGNISAAQKERIFAAWEEEQRLQNAPPGLRPE